MGLFRSKKDTSTSMCTHFQRIYQYSSGDYLPDTSQPNVEENYEISSKAYTPHTSTRYINISVGSNGKAKSCGKDTDRELPELYIKREDCCGCTACYAICPTKAITMRPCEEGFLYPVVDSDKCIRCYKCISVCPIKKRDVP